jgi:hypothetical protein
VDVRRKDSCRSIGGRDRKFLSSPEGNARAVLFTRGIALPPLGSVEDRVLRESLFRERRERVAQVEVFAKIIARISNTDAAKAFGSIIAEYEAEVFQETYDADVLKKKIEVIREAQKRLRAKRLHDEKMIDRLDRMGEYYDREYGVDLRPKVAKAPEAKRAK